MSNILLSYFSTSKLAKENLNWNAQVYAATIQQLFSAYLSGVVLYMTLKFKFFRILNFPEHKRSKYCISSNQKAQTDMSNYISKKLKLITYNDIDH